MTDSTVSPSCPCNDGQTVNLRLNALLRSRLEKIAEEQQNSLECTITVILAEKISVSEHAEWVREQAQTTLLSA